MGESLLITLREGFEAALVVAIVLAAVKRSAQPELARWVWYGTGAASLLAIAIGWILHVTIEDLTGGARSRVFAVICLALAVVLGVLVYRGSRFLPLRRFFQVTGVLIILFAAGLLSRGVLFLQSAGDLGTVNNAVYNLTGQHWLTQDSQTGRFLAGIFGWDPRPSIEQVGSTSPT